MEWFKHDSNANLDEKLQEVLLDYGLEGYGLYWYCIELIVGKVSADNITFELKHDARVIARNTNSTVQKVEEMMKRFVDVGLFENIDGRITCLKVARRLMTSATSNPKMRGLIQDIKTNHAILPDTSLDAMKQPSSCRRHDGVMQEENRIDKKERKDKYTPPIPAELLAEWLVIRKKKPVTERVFASIVKEAGKLGWTPEQAVIKCCERGWTGFEAAWVTKDKPKQNYQDSREAAALTAFGSLLTTQFQIEKVIDHE